MAHQKNNKKISNEQKQQNNINSKIDNINEKLESKVNELTAKLNVRIEKLKAKAIERIEKLKNKKSDKIKVSKQKTTKKEKKTITVQGDEDNEIIQVEEHIQVEEVIENKPVLITESIIICDEDCECLKCSISCDKCTAIIKIGDKCICEEYKKCVCGENVLIENKQCYSCGEYLPEFKQFEIENNTIYYTKEIITETITIVNTECEIETITNNITIIKPIVEISEQELINKPRYIEPQTIDEFETEYFLCTFNTRGLQ